MCREMLRVMLTGILMITAAPSVLLRGPSIVNSRKMCFCCKESPIASELFWLSMIIAQIN